MVPPKPNWVDQAFPFYEFLRVLSFFLDLECWIISTDSFDRWFEIRRHRRNDWPVDLDYFYGKMSERARYNEIQFKRVMDGKKTVCSTYNGLSSLSIPILRKGKVIGILQAGVFLRDIPTRGELLKHWKEMTGSEAVEFNPDLFHYVRTVLECPLVDAPIQQAVQELLEIYAKVLAGEKDPAAARQRAEELKVGVFAKHYHHFYWLDVLVKKNRHYPPSFRGTALRLWEMKEMGIQRLPTTVLALRVNDPKSHLGDDLDLLLLNYRFQRELYRFGRTLPETVVNPLEDYGVLFFTSPSPERNPTQAKAEIRDLAGRITQWVEKKLQVRVFCGASRIDRPGGNLSGVFRQALAALEHCRHSSQPMLFYEDLQVDSSLLSPTRFHDLSSALCDAYVKGVAGEAESARRVYLQAILAHSSGRAEMMRIHFSYALGQIVHALQRRFPLQAGELSNLLESFGKQLQEAGTAADLVLVFQAALRQATLLTLSPLQGHQRLRLEAARKYIDQNFSQDLKMENVARINGFSLSVFGRGFKKVAGMGFSAYLRKVRLEEAKKLLASTDLPISQVTQECGFNNLQYFFDVFKRSAGKTPLEFRWAAESHPPTPP